MLKPMLVCLLLADIWKCTAAYGGPPLELLYVKAIVLSLYTGVNHAQ